VGLYDLDDLLIFLTISTNDYQKLALLTYIFAADSMGLYSLVFT